VPPTAPGPGADRGLAVEVTAVTVFWRQLRLPGQMDVHTQFMPPNVLAKVRHSSRGPS